MKLHKLKSLLENKKRPIEDVDERGSIILSDKDSDQKYKIKDLPSDSLVVPLPKGQPGIFKSERKKGERNMMLTATCDYLIFVPNRERVLVMLCELKTTVNPSVEKKGVGQIKASIPLLDYILSGLKVHFNEKWLVDMRFIIIGKERKYPPNFNKTFPYFETIKADVLISKDAISIEDILRGEK